MYIKGLVYFERTPNLLERWFNADLTRRPPQDARSSFQSFQMMLDRYPASGKTVLLTAAGSDCAVLLGQWARQAGAEAVYGIHRSPVHAQRLAEKGIVPIAQHDMAAVNAAAVSARRVVLITRHPSGKSRLASACAE